MNHPNPIQLARALGPWFATHARPLPWRAPGTSPWAVLVSEVMSQQTPVSRVAPLWETWMRRWPQPANLAAAETSEILRMWANLGYPRRALRLRECAQTVVARHGGELPTNVSELLALPGVGAYTARAVAAFALDQAVPVVDTNVRRVFKRVARGEFLQGSARARDLPDVAALLPYVDADPAVKKSAPHLYNSSHNNPANKESALVMCAALMELGALVCTATNPKCDTCPIQPQCRWVALGKPQPSIEEQEAASRRVQKFAGTDRQVRGLVMKRLREDTGAGASEADIDLLWPDKSQLWRAVDSLVADGLAEVSAGASDKQKMRNFHLPS